MAKGWRPWRAISIHAPANGATTLRLESKNATGKISIHAPANGATLAIMVISSVLPISIHAPANGATFPKCPCRIVSNNFNPRSGERSDFVEFGTGVIGQKFQSTLRRTERQPLLMVKMLLQVFQSTLRRTERHCPMSARIWLIYFNPRSGERSDRPYYIPKYPKYKFQSTLRRTERQTAYTAPQTPLAFQSTLRRTERHIS